MPDHPDIHDDVGVEVPEDDGVDVTDKDGAVSFNLVNGVDVPEDFKRKVSRRNLRRISTFSTFSTVSIDPVFHVLSALIVFKILFVDIASSLGDNITDFLQVK